jgi:hypothetical protein
MTPLYSTNLGASGVALRGRIVAIRVSSLGAATPHQDGIKKKKKTDEDGYSPRPVLIIFHPSLSLLSTSALVSAVMPQAML